MTDPKLPPINHLPEDAGEYAEGLTRILNRFPEGWGRWIDVGRGWYPLIVELDRQITEVVPTYDIYQVKEKFGGLRFYIGPLTPDVFPLVHNLINAAEARSYHTCEVCGVEGNQVTTEGTGWVTSRCPECHQKPTQMGKF